MAREGPMKRVLVTGATGFIGRPSLHFLVSRGFEVHAITSRASDFLREGFPPEVRWHRADLLDSAQVQDVVSLVKPTHLLHLAWNLGPGLYTSTTNLDWVQAGIFLLKAFQQEGGRRVVTAGSGFEYDWRYGYCTEGITPTNPGTVYGRSKHALHVAQEALAEATGLSSAWGRIFWIYGPRESPNRLVPAVIIPLLQAEAARCSHGMQVRDFLHVEDVADALVTLLDSVVTGPVNIASGEPVRIKDVVLKIADLIGEPAQVHLGAIPAQPHEAPLVVANVLRLKNELGWRPKYDLDEGLAATIEWWKANLPTYERNVLL